MNKKLFVITIFILFIGVSIIPSAKNISIEKSTRPILYKPFDESVVSSTESLVEDNLYSYNPLESNNMPRELVSNGKIAYGSDALNYDLVKFPLDDPGNIEFIAQGDNTYFLTGGTWSYEHGWFAVEYNSGCLWLIDPETGYMENIGGGGFSGELAWDDWTSELYGASMQGLAFNSEGICYGVNGYYGSDYYLYIVDFDPYEETLIGPLINFPSEWVYNLNAEFDKDTDILYILSSEGLYTCDTETCECTDVGNTGGLLLSAFAIPYEDDPPVTTISFNPAEPDGCNGWYVSNVTGTLTATDDMSGVDVTYYRINEEEWKIYESPFVLSEDGDDILIEFYSVDDNGNVEDVKSVTIDIDKTPPEMNIEWDVEKIGWRKWRITFTINIVNETGVIDRIEIFINDADALQSVVTGSGPTYSWSFVIYGDPYLTLKFIAYDQACNQAIVIINSSEINTFPSIKSNTYRTKSVGFSQIFESFPLIQHFFDILRWYN